MSDIRQQILALEGERPSPVSRSDDSILISIARTPSSRMFSVTVQHKAGKDAHQWGLPRTGYIEFNGDAWDVRDDSGGLHSAPPRGSFPNWRDAVLSV